MFRVQESLQVTRGEGRRGEERGGEGRRGEEGEWRDIEGGGNGLRFIFVVG